MGEMSILGRKGDTKISWSPNCNSEVEQAKKTFEDYKKKGFSAFEVLGRGGKGKMIEEFDPDAGVILLVPPIAGG